MTRDLVLHEDAGSGNCYKIRLTAAHLGITLDRKSYDIMAGETRTPEFLTRINAIGKIPVLQIGDRFLAESNAACHWLAAGSTLIPFDRFGHADMLHWMFWEQYSHEPNIATMRYYKLYVGEENMSAEQRALVPGKIAGGEAALTLMDEHLGRHPFLAADRFSLADICLYGYTHVAGQGGFDLARWPHIGAWLERVAAIPGHISMDA
ncbi:glutathione S-transferase family protein [Parasphingopyxis marina]|uniref:Glutathione S-transferase family protein n=1 Tax=Parasphingopyxis marina TaxID=2761622 RepID=A0A842HW31_9SPHN|nr:glutathione S-transferase family protein [Parasphingopyxis marina]MBC2778278.1 glutathione S-transferase family protein [Parasphingopyxis marina]